MTVEESYRHCERVARSRARNFYYSFLLLPREKRAALCAVYAFMRRCDDLSDEPHPDGAPGARRALDRWRAELDEALAGRPAADPVWPAFADTARRYAIPREYFHAMIDGVATDLEPHRVETFDELYRYCYQVASVVGLTIIHVFGFEDPRALELAEKCGIAFQLTNIIRDVKEDAANGRGYLPAEDTARLADQAAVLRCAGERARRYYDESRPLVGIVGADSRRALWALIEIYRRLFEKIERSGYAVMDRRIRLTLGEKVAVVVQALFTRL
jgi:phytoene synthase